LQSTYIALAGGRLMDIDIATSITGRVVSATTHTNDSAWPSKSGDLNHCNSSDK